MEIFDIVDQIESAIEDSWTVPFIRKSMVDKDELMELLSDLRLRLPEDLKQAKWVKDERTSILEGAHQEAANIIKAAEEQMNAMVEESEITKKAYDQANQIVTNAQQNAREIRLGARQYAESMLGDLEKRLENQMKEIRAGREDLKK